jgi:hypothetical protein
MPNEKVVIMPKPKESPALLASPVLTFRVGGRRYQLRSPNAGETAGKVISMPSSPQLTKDR